MNGKYREATDDRQDCASPYRKRFARRRSHSAPGTTLVCGPANAVHSLISLPASLDMQIKKYLRLSIFYLQLAQLRNLPDKEFFFFRGEQ
ncbi:hypothetical protein [Burkholderia territorii]|uniref:hypothetical protein n=1 Tax=Burkholderia territorii TaxID=1503055 RepID=UPI0012D9ADED|nr:hypothetical protein [Burkholderia territorii]